LVSASKDPLSSGSFEPRHFEELAAAREGTTARELAREMFIRNALVDGQWRERHGFQRRNEALVEQAREVERRSRTHGLVADEQARFRFFDDLIPEHVTSAAAFNRWWKDERRSHPDLLIYPASLLMPREATSGEGFPDRWQCGDLSLSLSYEFAPGSPRDGVSMRIPIEVLERVSDKGTDWLVPGMREDLLTEAIRALPKGVRRLLAPREHTRRAFGLTDAVFAIRDGFFNLRFSIIPLTRIQSVSARQGPVQRWRGVASVQAELVPGPAASMAEHVEAGRCLAVDREGNLIDGDKIMGALAVNAKARGALAKDTLVVTVMSNLGLLIAMREAGIATVQTGVGDRYVLEEMLASGYCLGGEQSGHIIARDHATTGDGILSSLLVSRMVKESGRSLADLTSFIKRLPQTLINVGGVDRAAASTNQAVAEAVAAAEARLGDSGRVLLRPSGTEPLVRVMVEAATQEEADAVASSLADVVKENLAL